MSEPKDDTLVFPPVEWNYSKCLETVIRCGLIRLSLCRQDCPLRSPHVGQRGEAKGKSVGVVPLNQTCSQTSSKVTSNKSGLSSFTAASSEAPSCCSGSVSMKVKLQTGDAAIVPKTS